MATSPLLGITLPTPADNDAATLSRYLVWMEAMAAGRLLNHDQNAPPSSQSEGDIYATGAAASGAWSGQNEKLALYYNGEWLFADIPESSWWVSEQTDGGDANGPYDLIIRDDGSWATISDDVG